MYFLFSQPQTVFNLRFASEEGYVDLGSKLAEMGIEYQHHPITYEPPNVCLCLLQRVCVSTMSILPQKSRYMQTRGKDICGQFHSTPTPCFLHQHPFFCALVSSNVRAHACVYVCFCVRGSMCVCVCVCVCVFIRVSYL